MSENIVPRLLTRKEAAQYCNVCVIAFDRYVKKGVLPPKVIGTRMWDRKAIDIWLDRASGLDPSHPETTKPSDQPVPNHQGWLDKLNGQHQPEGTTPGHQ